MGFTLLVPRCKDLLKGLRTDPALLHAKKRAPVVGVDDRDIDPRSIFEKLEVALLIRLRGREPDRKVRPLASVWPASSRFQERWICHRP